eukprot:215832-Rhodomonas_salina.2
MVSPCSFSVDHFAVQCPVLTKGLGLQVTNANGFEYSEHFALSALLQVLTVSYVSAAPRLLLTQLSCLQRCSLLLMYFTAGLQVPRALVPVDDDRLELRGHPPLPHRRAIRVPHNQQDVPHPHRSAPESSTRKRIRATDCALIVFSCVRFRSVASPACRLRSPLLLYSRSFCQPCGTLSGRPRLWLRCGASGHDAHPLRSTQSLILISGPDVCMLSRSSVD